MPAACGPIGQTQPMQPDTLCALGRALFGPSWRTALAGALGVTPQRITCWANGHEPMPAKFAVMLPAVADARLAEVRQAVATLRRAA